MSATLDPIGYYQNVLGFPPGDTEQLILDSPFPEEHKKVIIIPTVSTRFSRRDQYYPAFADIIRNIVKTRKGNYLVFFPSFDFMQNVNLFLGNVNCTRIIQQRQMSDANREEVLETLRHSETDHLLLAVMGGIFSEGVDYTGDMCIGVIIFSPGLPQVTYGRELIREYYDQERGNGFEYAYMYPGINKVIQAAGRLIRSHQDKGVVVLVGERFAQESVSSLLPEHWIRHPENLVITSDYVNELRKFWSKFA
jgi:DNA excision repair protein ERCC-2